MAADSGYFITRSLSTGNVDVYFNHTVNTSVSAGEHAKGSQKFETLFINQINKAQYSIDVTLWGFSYYTSISDALINAKNRGVKVRFIYNHTSNSPLADSLFQHGIPVLKRNYDTTYSMHNKFLIFDYRGNSNPADKYLWTGSTNVSHPQFHSDRNNIILIQDESLCAVYTREFEEMWGSHTDQPDPARARFGDQKTDNVPHILNVGGKRMEVYFTPSDSVSAFLRNLIQTRATRSLFFSMLKFELPSMEETLHDVFNNGIQIRGVFDSANSLLPISSYPRMKGLPVANTWNPAADVFLDTIPGLIHHKYFIVDADAPGENKITSTGSFNWEIPADIGNDENSLTIFDNRVNNLYYQEFYQRYIESGGNSLQVQSVEEEAGPGFALDQNYPNPFSEQTTIKFTVQKVSDIKLVVVDLIGREVQTFTYKTLPPGIYESAFDGSSLPGGVYFYKISTGNYSETKKMILD
jgi:phosphatidylserine/phosphatidylglycerophosphate/cardiolipin synthase-like enzyme